MPVPVRLPQLPHLWQIAVRVIWLVAVMRFRVHGMLDLGSEPREVFRRLPLPDKVAILVCGKWQVPEVAGGKAQPHDLSTDRNLALLADDQERSPLVVCAQRQVVEQAPGDAGERERPGRLDRLAIPIEWTHVIKVVGRQVQPADHGEQLICQPRQLITLELGAAFPCLLDPAESDVLIDLVKRDADLTHHPPELDGDLFGVVAEGMRVALQHPGLDLAVFALGRSYRHGQYSPVSGEGRFSHEEPPDSGQRSAAQLRR